ncbi:cytochrome b-c1 complex subunit 9 [Tirmania nivea]|nr:cytochrome b-c1 complex subunit 9 [Tirmania nivea]
MALAQSFYNIFIKRNYVFVGTIFASAFAFEVIFDKTTDKIWDHINKGRQWKDIRHRYAQEE